MDSANSVVKCPDGHPVTHHHDTPRGSVYECQTCLPGTSYKFIVENDAAKAETKKEAKANRAAPSTRLRAKAITSARSEHGNEQERASAI